MLERLLKQLESPRRHLTVLVGLLVLTFVFTGLLAHEARRAELSRQETAHGVLRDMVAGAASDWALYFEQFTGTSLNGIARESFAVLTGDPSPGPAVFAGGESLAHFCTSCAADPDTHYFEMPVSGGSRHHEHDLLDIEVRDEILARIHEGRFALLHDRLGAFMHFAPDEGGRPAGYATYVVLDGNARPVRALGFHVPGQVVVNIVRGTFDMLQIVPSTLADGQPNGTFFDAQVVAGGGNPESDAAFAATHGFDNDLLSGLTLRVTVRPDADRRLVLGGTTNARLPLLVVLMVIIAGLILMALLLVRREADLVRLRADFVSGVSHELRTPLAQIRMFTETLLLGRVRSDIERRRSLEIIDQEARRLSHLVENVLLFSKTEGGRDTRFAPEPTSFAGEIRNAVESFAPLCRTHGVEIRTELEDRITAPVDRGALRQILLNLVDNAIKYGPAGQRITVGVALFDTTARVWVDDEGDGIPEPERERVFESFYRAGRHVESRKTGSGIGLAVVRQLARLHGGDAHAMDAPGGGARLLVEFPGAWLRDGASSHIAEAS